MKKTILLSLLFLSMNSFSQNLEQKNKVFQKDLSIVGVKMDGLIFSKEETDFDAVFRNGKNVKSQNFEADYTFTSYYDRNCTWICSYEMEMVVEQWKDTRYIFENKGNESDKYILKELVKDELKSKKLILNKNLNIKYNYEYGIDSHLEGSRFNAKLVLAIKKQKLSYQIILEFEGINTGTNATDEDINLVINNFLNNFSIQ